MDNKKEIENDKKSSVTKVSLQEINKSKEDELVDIVMQKILQIK